MFHRGVIHMFPKGNNRLLSLLMPCLPKPPTISFHRSKCIPNHFRFHKLSNNYRAARTLHTGLPLMVDKLLTVDEIFAMRSLQSYLKKMESDYGECWMLVNNNNNITKQWDEVELRAKRTKASLLALLIQCMETKQKEIAETESLLKEDPGLRELADLEIKACLKDIQGIRQRILGLLIPGEELELSDLVLEVTAGVGGQEAMLFTAEVFDMYRGFARHEGWAFEILEYVTSEIGGLRRASASISGPQCYKRMQFEAGVHRVQRVPKTERQGRMHTSTVTVVVLPQPTDISFTINPKDLRVETKRASGAGGQHVNTTDSAVRIVHLPTGVVSECQQERSQLKNRDKAMKVLSAKLYSMRLEEETAKRCNARKAQTGSKARSERIRTYNFAQDRITDHRLGKTVHNVGEFLLGEALLEEMNSSLEDLTNQEMLMDLLRENDQQLA